MPKFIDIIRNVFPREPYAQMEQPIPECPRCYQILEDRAELDLNRNPRQLCIDCMASEESLYNFGEIA